MMGAESFRWDWRHSEALTPKQSLQHAKVSGADRTAIARAIAEQLKPDMGGLGGMTEQELEDVALDTPVKLVDLNGDGTPEVIAQGTFQEGGCSRTGNCRFWVFQKSGDEYKLLISQERHPVFHPSADPFQRVQRYRRQDARFGHGKHPKTFAISRRYVSRDRLL